MKGMILKTYLASTYSMIDTLQEKDTKGAIIFVRLPQLLFYSLIKYKIQNIKSVTR